MRSYFGKSYFGQSHTGSCKALQVTAIILLMGLVSWLATGWQEQTAQLELSLADTPYPHTWSEEHLITPVMIERSDWTLGQRVQTDLHAL